MDFVASAEDVATEDPVTAHGYRGGPFVIDGSLHDDALPIVLDWQAAHPAVAVHRATAPFAAEAARELRAAPSIAIFVDTRKPSPSSTSTRPESPRATAIRGRTSGTRKRNTRAPATSAARTA